MLLYDILQKDYLNKNIRYIFGRQVMFLLMRIASPASEVYMYAMLVLFVVVN
jgi:hypothetical protein